MVLQEKTHSRGCPETYNISLSASDFFKLKQVLYLVSHQKELHCADFDFVFDFYKELDFELTCLRNVRFRTLANRWAEIEEEFNIPF